MLTESAYGSNYFEDGAENPTSPSMVGASVSAGVTPMPGLSIAAGITAGYLSAETERKTLAPGGMYEDSSDRSSGIFIPELEVHGFPFTRGPLHLMASGGLLTGGGEEFDDFFGFVAGLGVGAAFFVGDQTSIDLLARGRILPSGDHNSSLTLWSLDVGVLLQ